MGTNLKGCFGRRFVDMSQSPLSVRQSNGSMSHEAYSAMKEAKKKKALEKQQKNKSKKKGKGNKR